MATGCRQPRRRPRPRRRLHHHHRRLRRRCARTPLPLPPSRRPSACRSACTQWKFSSVDSLSCRSGARTRIASMSRLSLVALGRCRFWLHSAGANGAHEPEEVISNATVNPVPGIYVIRWTSGTSAWSIRSLAKNGSTPSGSATRTRQASFRPSPPIGSSGTCSGCYSTEIDPTDARVRHRREHGRGGAMKIAWLYPTVFAAGISSVGWVEDWSLGNGNCLPGVHWKTATGPMCQDMLNSVYLAQTIQTPVPPLFLTWGTNDSVLRASAAKHIPLLAAMEATNKPYMAEWRQTDHATFWLPGMHGIPRRTAARGRGRDWFGHVKPNRHTTISPFPPPPPPPPPSAGHMSLQDDLRLPVRSAVWPDEYLWWRAVDDRGDHWLNWHQYDPQRQS